MTHYFDKEQDTELRTKDIIVRLDSIELPFTTVSGVFSFGKPDRASLLLIDKAKVKGTVLDLGCGWGLIGISIKKLYPDLEVTLADVNERAVITAKKNAKKNAVRVTVIQSNGFKKLGTYDTILFNPPHHAGKEVCLKLLEDAYGHLNPGGSVQIVVRWQKGGRAYKEKMEEFGRVDVLGKSGGFRVLMGYV